MQYMKLLWSCKGYSNTVMIIISVYVNNEYLINVGVGQGVHTQIHPIV